MRTSWLLRSTVLVALLAAPAVAAPPAQKASTGPRRDPQGVKGISPFWESVKRGDDAFVTRDFDGALSAYREALTHEPQNALGHYRLGETYLAKNDLKEARASWETAKRFAQDQTLKAKVLFVLADLGERERSLDDATNGWNAYEGHARAQPAAKTYPETPPERKQRIETWKQLEKDYGVVKERIKKRLEEAEKS
jgi:tetratricopeptide (TPR) repeat protein